MAILSIKERERGGTEGFDRDTGRAFGGGSKLRVPEDRDICPEEDMVRTDCCGEWTDVCDLHPDYADKVCKTCAREES